MKGAPNETRIHSCPLLSILVDLNNAVIWMISHHPLISNFSSPSSVTVPRAPLTMGITVTFMLQSFFQFLRMSRYLSFFSLSFNFTLWSVGTAKSTIQQVLFFFSWLSLGLVVWPRLGDLFVSQNSREVYASHSLGQILSCTYTIWSYGQI